MLIESGWREDPLSFVLKEWIQWADHLIFVYPSGGAVTEPHERLDDQVFTPGIAYSANSQGSFIWNYLRGKQFRDLLKGKTASIYARPP